MEAIRFPREFSSSGILFILCCIANSLKGTSLIATHGPYAPTVDTSPDFTPQSMKEDRNVSKTSEIRKGDDDVRRQVSIRDEALIE